MKRNGRAGGIAHPLGSADLAPQSFPVATVAVGYPDADGPKIPSIEHDLNGFCWCQPVVEHLLEGDLYIHRRTLDSPHYESEPS